MYGGERINNHFILTYGLLKEFYKDFQSLQYSAIELPLTLNISFQSIIIPFVMQNLSKPPSILKMKYHIRSIQGPQTMLNRFPKSKKDLFSDPRRKTLLMPAAFLPFALKKFRHHSVILINSNHLDSTTVQKHKIPSNFEIFDLQKSISKVDIPLQTIKKITTQAQHIIDRHHKHEIYGLPKFEKWLRVSIIRSIKQICALEKLILTKGITAILDLTVSASPGNILSLLALKYKLPFIWIQYWLLTDASMIPSHASHYCVWGKNYKQWLVNKGIPQHKILPTGSLRFENEHRNTHLNRKQLKSKLDIPEEHKIITFTTQNFSEAISKKVIAEIMTWIKGAIKNLPITLVIKSRPGDRSYYVDYLEKQKIILSPLSSELYELLKNTDFLMTISSTTAIEAAMFKKGILVLQPKINYHFRKNYNDYHSHLAKASAGYVIRNEKDLYRSLNKLIKEETARSDLMNKGQVFLANSVVQNGSASDRIHSLIQSLLKNKR